MTPERIVRPFVCVLAGLAVLYHLTVGCCDHHAHAECCVERHGHHSHHGHAHPHSHDSKPSNPAPGHDDGHESHSNVVLPGKVAPPDQPAPALAAVSQSDVSAVATLRVVSRDLFHHPPPRFGDLRCHLVLQHFLN